MYVRKQGKAEEKAEDILKILEIKGMIPEKLRNEIQEERDLTRLDEWFMLAEKSKAVEAFLDQYC